MLGGYALVIACGAVGIMRSLRQLIVKIVIFTCLSSDLVTLAEYRWGSRWKNLCT